MTKRHAVNIDLSREASDWLEGLCKCAKATKKDMVASMLEELARDDAMAESEKMAA